MDEMCSVWWPRKNPDTQRIYKINSLRRDILCRVEELARTIDELLEYGLQPEADYVKDVMMKDYWKHEAGLNKLLCDANPDIKAAQWGWDSENTDWESSTVTCPDCWWEWDKTDKCPDCGYDFSSWKEEDA